MDPITAPRAERARLAAEAHPSRHSSLHGGSRFVLLMPAKGDPYGLLRANDDGTMPPMCGQFRGPLPGVWEGVWHACTPGWHAQRKYCRDTPCSDLVHRAALVLVRDGRVDETGAGRLEAATGWGPPGLCLQWVAELRDGKADEAAVEEIGTILRLASIVSEESLPWRQRAGA